MKASDLPVVESNINFGYTEYLENVKGEVLSTMYFSSGYCVDEIVKNDGTGNGDGTGGGGGGGGGNVARKRRKKILQLAKGYRGAHSRLFRVANQQVMKALRYSYVGRKQKKRVFRKLWITRINAASRLNGLSYSRLIHNFKKSNIGLNRKMLAQLAVLDIPTFNELVTSSK